MIEDNDIHNPLVSVIIPVYNAERYVEETLRSVFAQTYKNIEIIVVDDGSLDNSLEVVKKYESNIVRVFSKKNEGACAARNYGIAQSNGAYIQNLDADDLISPNKIEAQIDLLRNVGFDYRVIATSSMINFDSSLDGLTARNLITYKDYEDPLKLLLDVRNIDYNFLSHSYLVHQQLIKEVNGWDTSYLINQDGVFFTKLCLAAKKILFCGEATSYYRLSTPNSISKSKSEKSFESHIRSIKNTSLWILEREYSEEALQACFSAYLAVLLYWGIDNRYYFNLIVNDMKALNLKSNKGKLFKILEHILGLKLSLTILVYYKKIKRFNPFRSSKSFKLFF